MLTCRVVHRQMGGSKYRRNKSSGGKGTRVKVETTNRTRAREDWANPLFTIYDQNKYYIIQLVLTV